MDKKRINGNLVVGLLFIGIMAFLLIFGGKLTGFAVSENTGNNKLDIQVGNNYLPGEEIIFKILVYDEKNNMINKEVDYFIQNYYTDIIKEGSVDSGKEINFRLPENAIQGPWKITARFNGLEINRLFNVGELERADISLEGDILLIKNIGNSVYNKKILIYIGDTDQTAEVTLEIGQTKRIRLTGPEGDYDIRVIEGNEEKTIEFKDVRLTGNVVGLERVLVESFWKRYPMIAVFLGAIVLIAVIVGILKVRRKK